ncbi:hypothetical protein MATL_G00112940 [Megalops atlanticus]|uniref:guanylate cyclase n=1 Tax=Megalops atlanticus TaxID=7932 RepID=A0A9D3Q3F3_MEGAT|nr:hypothetical protein MATL_G00112940 [Megalops atlanticus]
MSSVECMKKDCFASGTLSSASLKGTFTKIQRRRDKARKRPLQNSQEETESDCDIFRCSFSSGIATSRTVRRILTACVVSFLALLGAVSEDLRTNLELLQATEAALHEFTSCRTNTILSLVGELQNERGFCTAGRSNKSEHRMCTQPASNVLSMVTQLCKEMQVHGDDQGHPCNLKLSEICEELESHISSFTHATPTTGDRNVNGTAALSLSILRILKFWGDPEEDVRNIKVNADWADVLSLRLLVALQELNCQLRESLPLGQAPNFQDSWYFGVSTLTFAMQVSETLQGCWMENGNLRLNLTQLLSGDLISLPWVAPGSSIPLAQTAVNSLGDVRECLLEEAGQKLRRKSRDLLSSLSLKICLLTIACLIYPIVMLSFKQMTEWIQNYARSLKERTEDLKKQRRLAEDLLHQMLPKSVAKQLRQQKHVKAESYEKVTIFFSDIVGFTAISASCTPMQVVEMLNNLYMCFDTRIDSYDVYKVETIGDAYMVVSGLPERNGDKHADEIAKMSLDLVAAVRQVPIPHMPSKRLQLRAGIHTGPCVAGIVGYKMPRYCLFGDTVNTASRMESTSLPQRVHASSDTYLALMKDNAYELQFRGEIEIKGKGKMKTYWLIGHKNYSVQNDSLVCHWNPNLARKKKKVGTGSSTSIEHSNTSLLVPGTSENNTPVSLLDSDPCQAQGSEGALLVAAQVEKCTGGSGTLGSMVGGLQGYNSPHECPRNGNASSPAGDKPQPLPGSVQPI